MGVEYDNRQSFAQNMVIHFFTAQERTGVFGIFHKLAKMLGLLRVFQVQPGPNIKMFGLIKIRFSVPPNNIIFSEFLRLSRNKRRRRQQNQRNNNRRYFSHFLLLSLFLNERN